MTGQSTFKSFESLPLSGKSVLLRVDYNIPMDGDILKDTTRIDASLPTLIFLLEQGAKITLISHRGRPKDSDESLSLKPLLPYLANKLNHDVTFETSSLITLKENLRFNPGEESNDPLFAKKLAEGHDLFIDDAFSVCHRAHASTVGVTHFLPSYAGLALRQEVETLTDFIATDNRPLMVLVGGAKISSKIDVVMNLLTVADTLVLGGAMANTFLMALGYSVGTSLVEPKAQDIARSILNQAALNNVKVLLPLDGVVAESPDHPPIICSIKNVPQDHMILDCGPETLRHIEAALKQSKTVVWNGPFGLFEKPPYDQGSISLARTIGRLTQEGHLKSLAGGGDTLAALASANEIDRFTATCTAGGAFLDWLAGKSLPGLDALLKE